MTGPPPFPPRGDEIPGPVRMVGTGLATGVFRTGDWPLNEGGVTRTGVVAPGVPVLNEPKPPPN